MSQGSTTRLTGIIGFPIGHSLSPSLHGYWFRELGVDGIYVPLHVFPQRLGVAVRGLGALGFCGVNVTVPHKETVLEYIDDLDVTAQRIGAVNTIVLRDGGCRSLGLNTDAEGYRRSLESAIGKDWGTAFRNVMLIGAGGAARAILVALLETDFECLYVVNRTWERAVRLVKSFEGEKEIRVYPWERRNTLLSQVDLLINTTTLGMQGQPPLPIDLSGLPEHAWVSDIVYRPLVTDLLCQARRRRLRTVDGLDMLMYQGCLGFDMWFGRRPQVSPKLRRYMESLI